MYRLRCSIGAKLTELEERIPRVVAWSSDRLSKSSSSGSACKPKQEIQPLRAPLAKAGEAIKGPLTVG